MNKKQKRVEDFVVGVSDCVKQLNAIEHQPEINLWPVFNFGFDSYVFYLFVEQGFLGKYHHNMNSRHQFEQARRDAEDRAIGADDELATLYNGVRQTAFEGDDFETLTGLLGQLKVKENRGDIGFTCHLNLEELYSEAELTLEIAESLRDQGNIEARFLVDRLENLLSKDKIGGARGLPADYVDQMSIDSIARIMFNGDAPRKVPKFKVPKRSGDMYVIKTALGLNDIGRLTNEYAKVGACEKFEISPEQAARETVELLDELCITSGAVVDAVMGYIKNLSEPSGPYSKKERGFTRGRWAHPRPGIEISGSHENIHIVNDVPQMEISASFIRNAIKQGQDVSYLIPEKAWQYIDEMNFYK